MGQHVPTMPERRPTMVCKLRLHTNQPQSNSDQGMHTVRFGAVYANLEKDRPTENAIFGKYTPWAEFNAGICNQEVLANLKEGKEYYVTFTEAPSDEPVAADAPASE